MKYEILVAERLGPLMSTALTDVEVLHLLPQTRLTIVGPEPVPLQRLVLLIDLGLEIDEIRCCAPILIRISSRDSTMSLPLHRMEEEGC